jgi:hypothetical protein
VVGLFQGTREGKRMIVNNIEIHFICIGRWQKETKGKLLNDWGWGRGRNNNRGG